MAWIESHTVLSRHRKVKELARSLRLKPVYAMGHLHALWHDALEQQEDGDLTKWSDELIAESSQFDGDAPQYVSLLQAHGWLDRRLIHDWTDYAGAYLRGKYHNSNRPKLVEIWAKHGKTYGKEEVRKEEGNKEEVKRLSTVPDLTVPDLTRRIPPVVPPGGRVCFQDIWKMYPKRIGRKAAERHFKASVKTAVDGTDIRSALANYLRSDEVKRGFVQNGSTWFNNWRDWVTVQGPMPVAVKPYRESIPPADELLTIEDIQKAKEKS